VSEQFVVTILNRLKDVQRFSSLKDGFEAIKTVRRSGLLNEPRVSGLPFIDDIFPSFSEVMLDVLAGPDLDLGEYRPVWP
jgi:hypothetical protein